MSFFADSAKKETSISRVMEGREKISMKSLKELYPKGVTVTEFDFITINDPKKGECTFSVFAFAEDDTKCAFGGEVMNRICQAWANGYGGDVDKASEELRKSGGVKIRLYSTQTRSGNPYTAAEVID